MRQRTLLGPIYITALLLVLMFVAFPAAAQTGTTAIYGQVNDPAGAAIVGAQVTLENAGTKAVRTATTDSIGGYRFSSLPPGLYLLSVEMKGFRVARIENLELTVNTTTKQDVALVIGAQNEIVEVTGNAEVLNTTDASLGHPFTEQRIKDLPLEARNVVGLLSLQTGAVFVPKSTLSPGQDNDPRNGSISGSHSDQSNVTLDGVDANDAMTGYSYTSVLRATLDSVQEFRVTTSNYGADQGRSSAAQVTLVTKSGSNNLHGSAYWYNRNTSFSSNEWFNKMVQTNNLQPNQPAKLNKQIGGASLGAPLKKDRLFFFANWEYRRDTSETPVSRTVPSDTYRDGVIVYQCNDATKCPGGTVQGYKNAHAIPAGWNGLTPAQLTALDPLHIGPSAGIQTLFNQAFPVGNVPGRDGTLINGAIVGNAIGLNFLSPIKTSMYTYIGRLDYHLDSSGKHTLFLRGNLQDDRYAGSQYYPGKPPSTVSLDNSRGLAAGYTAVLSPTMVNNFRFGFTRFGTATAGLRSGNYVTFRNLSEAYPQTSTSGRHLPTYNFVDDFTWTRGTHTVQFGGNLLLNRINKFTNANSFMRAYANTGWIAGTGRNYAPGVSCPAPITATCLALPAYKSTYRTAYTEAWITALGVLSEADANYNFDHTGAVLPVGAPVPRLYASNDYEFYGQDTWRAKPNLMLTFGLRWGVAPAPYEMNGNQVTPTVNLSDWFAQRDQMMKAGTPSNTMPELVFDLSGPANGKSGYYKTDWNNFSPRASFAWTPRFSSGLLGAITGNGKAVVRGGYAMVYDHFGVALANDFDENGSYGMSSYISSTSGLPYETMPGMRYVNYTTMPSTLPTAPAGGFPKTPPRTFTLLWGAVDPKLTTPYAHTYNLTIGRELKRDMTLEVGYVGRQGRDLLIRENMGMYLNLVDPKSGMDYFTAARKAIASIPNASGYNDTATFATVPSIPYFENLFPGAAGTYKGVKLTATQAMVREFYYYAPDWVTALQEFDQPIGGSCYPACSIYGPYTFYQTQYSGIGAERSIGHSEYHSMQVSLRRRMAQGVQFDLNYTLSKSSDLGSQNERGSQFNSGWKNGSYSSFIYNAWDPNQGWATSDFDARHNINLSYVLQLPFGRNKLVGGGAPGWMNAVIGDWQISGIYRWNSGFPFTVQNCGSCWPTDWELQGNAMLKDPSQKPATGTTYGKLPGGYPSPFKDPAKAITMFRYALPGEAGLRNNFRGDRYLNTDMAIGKTWNMPYREGHKLKFRWDIFNLTNTPNFDVNGISMQPDNGTSFGRYNYTITGCDSMANRCMQGSLRYEF